MPTLTITGLPSSLEGLNDGYVQTGQTNNGQPVWIGTRNRAVAFLCGGIHVGLWTFLTIIDGDNYQTDMSACRGEFYISLSGKRQLYTRLQSWIDVDVTVTCTSCQAPKTRTRSLLVLFEPTEHCERCSEGCRCAGTQRRMWITVSRAAQSPNPSGSNAPRTARGREHTATSHAGPAARAFVFGIARSPPF